MDDILYKRKTLLQELYTILLSPSPDKEGGGTSAFSPLSSLGAGPYIDNIVLNIVNNNQSNIEWEKILHKIRGKYSYTFQSCDKAMELWIELLNTSINGWHESVTEDGKAYWWRKGMDAKIDIQWENPTKYQSSATTATEQEDPEEEISSETSDYATQFHAKFSEMQRKMQRNKPLEAALSRSNHHKPTEKKVSKIAYLLWNGVATFMIITKILPPHIVDFGKSFDDEPIGLWGYYNLTGQYIASIGILTASTIMFASFYQLYIMILGYVEKIRQYRPITQRWKL